jgi:hypothetical protein
VQPWEVSHSRKQIKPIFVNYPIMQQLVILDDVIASFFSASGDSLPVKLNSSRMVAIGIDRKMKIETQWVIITCIRQLNFTNAAASFSAMITLNS